MRHDGHLPRINASTSSGLSTELNLSQNMTRHAYLQEINITLRLHQSDTSSKRSAQRQYNKRDQIHDVTMLRTTSI